MSAKSANGAFLCVQRGTMAEGEVRRNTTTYSELGVTGLDIWSGYVTRDPEIKLQGTRGVDQYDLMRIEDPTVAAVLGALSLPVRRAAWTVQPASDKAADRQAAEFVESCLDDMTMTFDDLLSDICSMFAFGWSYFEWVLKRRQGYQRIGAARPASKFDDGRVGFRKIVLRAQTSLHRWEIDDWGGIQGMWQMSLTQPRPVLLPIEKCLLFRTSKEANNPEGLSVLRPAYRDWTYKRNMERIEGIGLQRALMGLPVVKLEQGATRTAEAGAGSDEAHAENIIAKLHSNKALGVIETDRTTFRFESPDMTGVTGDSDRVIQRKDQGIVRAALAMWILLGSNDTGSWALSRELGDLFFLAVEGYLGSIADVLNRYVVPVLMRYNAFPGISGWPEIVASVNRRIDLAALATMINGLVNAQVLTPDDELERHVRELAELPEAAPETARRRVAPSWPGVIPDKEEPGDELEPEEGGDEDPERAHRRGRETFARRRGQRAAEEATDAYQAELQAIFDEWAAETAVTLSRAESEEDLRDEIAAALAALLLLLKRRGYAGLAAAFEMGYGGAPGPAARKLVDAELEANDFYLETSLVPAIRKRLEGWIDELLVLIVAGNASAIQETVAAQLAAFRSRVGLYAGQYWHAISAGAVERVREVEREDPAQRQRIAWVLDSAAKHCRDCLAFAGVYESCDELLVATGGILPGAGTECDGNCRCQLNLIGDDGTRRWISDTFPWE